MRSTDKHNYEWVTVDRQIKTMVRTHAIAASTKACDVTGPFWVLGCFRIASGSISFMGSSLKQYPAPKRYVMWLPPGSVTMANMKKLVQTGLIHLGVGTPAASLPKIAGIVKVSEDIGCDYLSVINAIPTVGWKNIGLGCNADPLSIRVKRVLDQDFRKTDLLISQIAQRLGCSISHMSRKFSSSYGIPPKKYLSRLRILAATLQIADGTKIIDVSEKVGFNDLARFNIQFRSIAKVSPKAFRSKRKSKKRQVS